MENDILVKFDELINEFQKLESFYKSEGIKAYDLEDLDLFIKTNEDIFNKLKTSKTFKVNLKQLKEDYLKSGDELSTSYVPAKKLGEVAEDENMSINVEVVDMPEFKQTDQPKFEVEQKPYISQDQKIPVELNLFGENYKVNSYEDLFFKMCQILLLKEPYLFSELDKNTFFNNESRTTFSYDKDNILFIGKKLSNGMWVEINLSPEEVVDAVYKLLEICGYKDEDIEIIYDI